MKHKPWTKKHLQELKDTAKKLREFDENKIKATIDPVIPGRANLWLVIDRDDDESNAHPILADEVEAVMEACKKWLKDNQ